MISKRGAASCLVGYHVCMPSFVLRVVYGLELHEINVSRPNKNIYVLRTSTDVADLSSTQLFHLQMSSIHIS